MNERLNFDWPQRTADSPDTTPIDIAEELVVATDASAWFVGPEGYLRLPLDGEFRTTQTLATDPSALVDGALSHIETSTCITTPDSVGSCRSRRATALRVHKASVPELSLGASIPAPGVTYSG